VLAVLLLPTLLVALLVLSALVPCELSLLVTLLRVGGMLTTTRTTLLLPAVLLIVLSASALVLLVVWTHLIDTSGFALTGKSPDTGLVHD